MGLNTQRDLEKIGFALLALVSAYAALRLIHHPVSGHYRIFAGAAHAIWSGQSPYGSDFGTGVGLWFYSPACALLFFKPFDLLPEKLGLAAYMVASWVFFVWSARAFARAARVPVAVLGFFWAAIAPQMLSAILSSKLEIWITATLFFAGAALLSGRGRMISAVLLGAAIEWKFQPLPVFGLLCIVAWIAIREWRWPAIVAATVIALRWIPRLLLSRALVERMDSDWSATLGPFITGSWLHFENLHALAQNGLGLHYGFATGQAVSLAVGLMLALTCGLWVWARRKDPDRALRGGALLALGLGSFFIVGFSPLNQNNGAILYAPLLLAALAAWSEARKGGRRAWGVLLAATLAMMFFAYSDVVPPEERARLHGIAIKSVAPLALALALVVRAWRDRELTSEVG